jgi:glycosyltransferase involved in cell wall biosynthesis
MRISVILPLYNGALWVKEAIDSVLAQTHADLELIIIDDHSSDQGPMLIQSAYQHHPQVHLLTNPDKGIASARNHGLLHTSGEIIGFIDQDDLWTPDKLTHQLPVLTQHPDSFILGQLRQFCNEVTLPHWARKESINQIKPGWEPGTLLLYKTLLTQFSGFNTAYQHGGDDSDLFRRMRDAKVPYHIVPQLVLEKRIHQNNTSGNPNNTRDLIKFIRDSLKRRPSI